MASHKAKVLVKTAMNSGGKQMSFSKDAENLKIKPKEVKEIQLTKT